MFERTSLNQPTKDNRRVTKERLEISATTKSGVWTRTTALSSKVVLLTAHKKGHAVGDTLFKFDIFSLVCVFTIKNSKITLVLYFKYVFFIF